MGSIFMRVNNPVNALETLLYAFKNQIELGKRHLSLTIKHRDGINSFSIGTVDEVFNGNVVKDIELGDLVLLEHTNDTYIKNHMHLSTRLTSLYMLKESVENISTCSFFIIPKGIDEAYFIFKNSPMARYTVYRNEIISDKVLMKELGTVIMNNICGKINYHSGVYNTLTTWR